MRLRISPLTQACALALGLAVLQGCDSSGKFTSSPVISQSIGGTGPVAQAAPNNNGNTTGSTGVTGGGAANNNDDSDNSEDGGDTGSGDNGDSEDGGDIGSGDNGGGTLGPVSSELAIDVLDYSASHANLAHFAQALAAGSYTVGTTYNCAAGGTATLNSVLRSTDHATPTWNFNDCVLNSETGTSVKYNGQMSSSCATAARTGNDNAQYCEAVFTQFKSEHGDHTKIYNGTYSTVSEGSSLRSDAAGFSTESDGDIWTSPSQTIASEGSELRGLNTRVNTKEDGLAISALGGEGYRQAANGCLNAGTLVVKDAEEDAEISISAAVGGNMVVNDGDSSSTISCTELNPMPYTRPQFN